MQFVPSIVTPFVQKPSNESYSDLFLVGLGQRVLATQHDHISNQSEATQEEPSSYLLPIRVRRAVDLLFIGTTAH